MNISELQTNAMRPVVGNIDTLIHIGAGGADLDEHLASRPRRLVLIEPIPALAKQLRQKTAMLPNVEVLEMAIVAHTDVGGLATIHEYNWNQASGLHQPADLLSIFPGLKAVNMHRVRATTPAALFDELGLPENGEHALLLETPGEEPAIINGLAQSGHLKSIATLTICYPAAGLYQGATTPAEMLERVAAQGFDTVERSDEDPDWPVVTFNRNPLQNKVDELQRRLTSKNQALCQLNKTRAQADDLVKTLNEDLRETRAAAQALQEERDALKTKLDQSQQERDDLAKSAEERQGEVAQLAQAKAALEQEKSELAARLEEMTKTVEERQGEVAQLAQAKATLEQEKSELAARLNDLAKTAEERQGEVAQLTQEKETLEQEKFELATRLDEMTKTAEQRQGEVAQLAQAKVTLEQEKFELAGQLADAHKRLQEQETGVADANHRQQLMHDELARAEAQIDLIKELLLQEPSHEQES